MLEPENRQLLFEALRPPVGYALDRAVGTTYSLDLMSLLAAPLAFALFDRELTDGRLVADPIALLDAVRRYSDRIDVFCQAGQIAIPREHRALLTYLEDSIHEVVPPDRHAIFHPKVWVIRYRSTEGDLSYRLLCLSRNLTFDRSWDSILVMDGERSSKQSGDPKLSRFVARMAQLAVRGITNERAAEIRQLAEEVGRVVFAPPPGFDRVAFWPLGLGQKAWPFEGRILRLLIASPFLTEGCLSRFPNGSSSTTVVSRPEALDRLGGRKVAGLREAMVLSPSASQPLEGSDDELAAQGRSVDEAVAEAGGTELLGLHAKLYVIEASRRARLWTGSANATDAAFGGNVEFLIELEGPRNLCGIEAIVGAGKDRGGMRKLLEPYMPADDDPLPPTDAEKLDSWLDSIRRGVARQAFVARVEEADGHTYALRLEVGAQLGGRPEKLERLIEPAKIRIRPLTLGDGYFRSPIAHGRTAVVDFGTLSFEALTSFFVVELEAGEGRLKTTVAFVVNADLVGAPTDRKERTLTSLLANRGELIRFLLLLLGGIGAEDPANAIDVLTGDRVAGGETWLLGQWQALLEPMVRALAGEPGRLDEIERLITELGKTESSKALLPEGWTDVWDPIWAARGALQGQ